MEKIRGLLKNIESWVFAKIYFLKRLKFILRWLSGCVPLRKEFGYIAPNAALQYPLYISTPSNVYMEENTRLRPRIKIINSPNEKVVIKKYSVIAPDVTIVTGNHRSTVGIPHFLLGASHINDKSTNIIIEEDVWVGTGCLLLPGTHLGRGCIVGARTIVNKEIPPYCLVAGNPARIIKKKFSIEQILKHEKVLYAEKDRYTKEQLEKLFLELPRDLKIYGTDTGIDDNGIEIIEKLKKATNYVEPF